MSASSRNLAGPLLALAAVLQLTACGSDSTPQENRIARQELRDAGGALTIYWTYEYDANGYTTVIRAFSPGGAGRDVSTISYAGGLPTQAVVNDAAGVLLYTTTYSYVAGALDRSTFTYPSGVGDGYTVYVFADGKKQTSARYMKDGSKQLWNEFAYDAATGRRTGGTSHDAADAVIGGSTRTYADGLFTSTQLVNRGVTTTRSFTYEVGPLAVDYDLLFEF